jgi:hypothetical protein
MPILLVLFSDRTPNDTDLCTERVLEELNLKDEFSELIMGFLDLSLM